MYLELVYNRHEAAAKRFVERYGNIQESFFQVGIVNASALSMQRGLSQTATPRLTLFSYRRTSRNCHTSRSGST